MIDHHKKVQFSIHAKLEKALATVAHPVYPLPVPFPRQHAYVPPAALHPSKARQLASTQQKHALPLPELTPCRQAGTTTTTTTIPNTFERVFLCSPQSISLPGWGRRGQSRHALSTRQCFCRDAWPFVSKALRCRLRRTPQQQGGRSGSRHRFDT